MIIASYLKRIKAKVIPKSDDLKAQQSQNHFIKYSLNTATTISSSSSNKQEKKVKTSINANRNEANCLTGWDIYTELILVGWWIDVKRNECSEIFSLVKHSFAITLVVCALWTAGSFKQVRTTTKTHFYLAISKKIASWVQSTNLIFGVSVLRKNSVAAEERESEKCEKRQNHHHHQKSKYVLTLFPFVCTYIITHWHVYIAMWKSKSKKKNRKQFNYKTFSFTFLTNQPSFISKFIIKPVSSTETDKIHSPFAKLCFTAAAAAVVAAVNGWEFDMS